MKCPHCLKTIKTEAVLKEAAKLLNAARKVHGAGTGRPRSKKRCKCGEMTRDRAKQRGHKC